MKPCFVVDATAFFGGLQELRAVTSCGECATTPAVLAELKTPGLRAQVELLLPGLQVRSCTAPALARVVAFAKKTGDAAVLSRTDLELIALAAELMEQRGEAGQLRDSPHPPADVNGSGTPGWVAGEAAEEGWLGAAAGSLAAEAQPSLGVNFLSSDFAAQNVCLQMGIAVLALDGQRVARLRGYQLACDSCQRTTKQTRARFCPHCGHATLARLACEYGADGSTTFFRKRNRRVNLRGARYPLPQPRGGRHADLVLCADDLAKPQVRALARQQRRANPWGVELPALGAETDRVPVGYGRRNPNASAFWKHKRR